jgi:uncharacterized membrane protein YkvA (DUF1232 family)
MAVRLLSWLFRPALIRTLVTDARLALRLAREPRVPASIKALLLLGALYVVSPLDLVPDFFPLAGQFDDIAVIVGALKIFLGLCPAAAVAFHRSALGRRLPYSPMSPDDQVIDAEFRRHP